MAATSDQFLEFRNVEQAVRASYPIASGATIYQSALVGLNSGTARALNAGDQCLGLAVRKFVQADGDDKVETISNVLVKVSVTGVSGAANVGALVYASDDSSYTTTPTNNSLVGVVVEHVSGTTCWVKILDQAGLKAMAEPSV